MDQKTTTAKNFGTAPVFFTAISTILGAILFLRFGIAVGSVGFWGVILIILLGHMVTIPTAFAISEIATNKRVEGGGEYFIISRSFGLNIGATIGIALFFSQAISIAFYIIAFTESFEFLFNLLKEKYNFMLPRQVISIPAMIGLAILIIKKGSGIGVKTLYFVVAILFISLVLFFMGKTDFTLINEISFSSFELKNIHNFFVIFAIIFPAFTGMTAGVGLSGDLKNPSKSIPLGTATATIAGMIIYMFITYKLAISASTEDLTNNQLIMAKIAIGGAFIIPLGLAASTLSSAIGSILVAPRTLQALAFDKSFPSKRINNWLSKECENDGEPINATIVSAVIAIVFVAAGNVNAVAEIISMFFMVTYGSLCLISFLNHFGASPSYRPSFKSKWYISLLGFSISVIIMFKINAKYAIASIVVMTLLYILINVYHKNRKGFEAIFANTIFQINRNLQVYLQKKNNQKTRKEWRPSVICISQDSFERSTAFQLLNWISYKYGFGTYMHFIQDFFNRETFIKSRDTLKKLVTKFEHIENHVYIDTLISPSYTSAIAQTIQIPGIAGMENNMVIFEFDKENPENLRDIIDNFSLVDAGNFDVCILGSSPIPINFKKGIHVWINSNDTENANLMILLSFIILGHPSWNKSNIKIFEICAPEKVNDTKFKMRELVKTGRLPITAKNIEIIVEKPGINTKSLIAQKSKDAGLVILGFHGGYLTEQGIDVFWGYNELGNVLFVNSHDEKSMD